MSIIFYDFFRHFGFIFSFAEFQNLLGHLLTVLNLVTCTKLGAAKIKQD